MLNEKKSKRGTVIALLCALALLALVILLENTMKPTGMLFTVLKKGAVYALVAVSMNLLNGFTGLFSLGQAGFMLLGAYTYAILTIPTADREAVYYLYNGSAAGLWGWCWAFCWPCFWAAAWRQRWRGSSACRCCV